MVDLYLRALKTCQKGQLNLAHGTENGKIKNKLKTEEQRRDIFVLCFTRCGS